MKLTATLLTTAALTGSAFSAVIYDFNYDGRNPSSQSGGSAANGSYSITTDGVGGTGGGNATFNSTGQTGNFTFANSISNGRNGVLATSVNASDYVISFDIKAIGLLAGQSVNGQASIGFNFSPRVERNGVSVTDTFQSYSFNLGSDFTSVPTLTVANVNNNMQFRFEDFSAHNSFGRDSGNSIILDNVMLTQVPEPTSALLLGSAGLLGLLRRRRA